MTEKSMKAHNPASAGIIHCIYDKTRLVSCTASKINQFK